jgi:hypothetical protein
MWYIKKKSLVFYYKNTYNYTYFLETMCLRMIFFPYVSHLWAIPSHIIMIQNQQEFKIQAHNVP